MERYREHVGHRVSDFIHSDRNFKHWMWLLEYSESSCELDTWQERLGHERATAPDVGRKILLLAVHGKLIYRSILRYKYTTRLFYGFTVTSELVLLSGTCPRLACNSIVASHLLQNR